ncbi:FecCD family ABC transporter permease [Sphingomonas sp. MMS12-HWE2-04]|uniref:FecCD family ABC transporter permease n=1 Tax=Sphingomonas sp. MMS12-HWE2-04 TaxID=3234199 RepID=UPI00384AEA1F
MNRWLIPALLATLALASSISLICGTVWLTPGALFAGIADPHPNLAALLVNEIRLPRLVLAILVGAILGLSGAVLQGLLRNPLAEPGLLGVTGGASLGAVIAIYFGFSASFVLASPIFALIGAMLTAGLAFMVARGSGTLALILAGAAISSVAYSGVYLALNFAPNPYAAYEIVTWLMGSLQDRSWDHVQLAGPFILFGGALLLLTGRALDAMALGEAQAESLGVDVVRTRLLALVGIAFGVGAATAVTGAVGFVGLVAPHLVRPLVGYRPGGTLIPAALAGALLVVVADICTRVIHFGPPIQLGVFISIVGAPFFLWLVLHVHRRTA